MYQTPCRYDTLQYINIKPSLLCHSQDEAACFDAEVSAAGRNLCRQTTWPSKHRSLSAGHFIQKQVISHHQHQAGEPLSPSFLANVNPRSRSLFAVARPSVCRL